MATFGKMTDIRGQYNGINNLDVVFDYLDQAATVGSKVNERIQSMACDQYNRVEITGDIFAIEQSYNTKSSEGLLFESHIKYVDFQFLISGEEAIGVVHTDLLKIDSDYNKENDYSLYKANPDSSKIIMKKGDFSIFFPKDGHMPGITRKGERSRVFKAVVKVPILFFRQIF